MTRAKRPPARPLPPRVTELVTAPELAAIALLDAAIEVATAALIAEHMTLIDDFNRPRDQGHVVSLAHTICRRATGLRDAIVRYTRAVRDAAAPDDDHAPDDDLPF